VSVELILGMRLFSLPSPHLRSPARGYLKFTSQEPQHCLKETSRIPHTALVDFVESIEFIGFIGFIRFVGRSS